MIGLRLLEAIAVPLGFGFIFLASGVSKCLRASSVAHMVCNYRLLSPMGARVTAGLLGPTEAAAGVLLLLSISMPIYRVAWAMSIGLLLVFTAAIGSALARGLRIPCGCGLLLNGHVISWMTLVRNLVMLAVLALDFLMRRRGIAVSGIM